MKTLPQVLRWPKLNMFVLGRKHNVCSLEIPSTFFEEMETLKVLDLTNLVIPKLPASLRFLKSSLQCLCLDRCTLDDIALVGELRNLEILSFMNSRLTKLPKEIGQLTNLRLLDLDNCSRLEVIPPNVLSSLKSLEDLSMRNSFKKWEGEGGVTGEGSNANLLELKNLSQLAALEIHIPNANILPTNLFSNMRLERYQIFIGDAWKRDEMGETTLNTLKLKLSPSSGLDHGLNMLLKTSEVLYLDGTKGVYPLNSEKVWLANLTTLSVGNGCDGSKFLLSSSIARALVQLKHLRISKCAMLEEIVSKQEYGEEKAGNMFCKLEHLELRDLPKLARFCSGNYIELVYLKNLDLENCPKLVAFVSDPMSESITTCNEIEEMDSNEIKIDNHRTAVRYFLFDDKVRFPRLERLAIDGLSKLMTVWHNQIAPASFCQLSSVKVKRCDSLINIVNETHDSSTTELKTYDGQNLDSVEIGNCDSLKSVFPASMARGLHRLQKMEVVYCEVLEEIIAKDDQLPLNTPPPKFVFPKVTSVEFRHLPVLTSFYPGMHVSEWPLLEELEVYGCHKVETFAAEFMKFQKQFEFNHPSAPVKQPLFIIEHSFPKLEYLTLQLETLEIWYGPAPEDFFKKLKCIDFYWSAPFSQLAAIFFLQKLHNLEQIEVGYGPFQELFVDEINGSEAVQALPHVTSLRLDTMYNLRHLGKEKSESGGPVFPNLEILDVQFCQRLKNLESSAISFHNLTTLKVHYCAKLEYLTTSSVAKGLMRLTRLEVVDCEKMTEIVVASNGDDGDNAGGTYEIAFSRLEHLQLHGLPRLQGFCSGNSFVKFPTLRTLSMSRSLKLKIFPHDESLSSTDSKLEWEVDDEEPTSGVDEEKPESEFNDEETESD